MAEKPFNKHVFFHLGLPKAASTYLQRVVFPKLRGIQYFPKKHFKKYPELIEETDYDRYLFSDEMYSNLEKRVASIGAHYPNAGAIFVLRRHDQWLTSRYKYYLKKKGYLNFREYFNIHNNQGWLKKESLYFRKKLEAIENAFKKKPLILFHEELKEHPETFFHKLISYTGAELNFSDLANSKVKQSFNEKQLVFLRKFNRAFPYQKPKKLPKPFKKLKQNLHEGFGIAVANIALFLPWSLFKDEPLIPTEDLKAIRDYYQEDWKYCQAFANKTHQPMGESESKYCSDS